MPTEEKKKTRPVLIVDCPTNIIDYRIYFAFYGRDPKIKIRGELWHEGHVGCTAVVSMAIILYAVFRRSFISRKYASLLETLFYRKRSKQPTRFHDYPTGNERDRTARFRFVNAVGKLKFSCCAKKKRLYFLLFPLFVRRFRRNSKIDLVGCLRTHFQHYMTVALLDARANLSFNR